MTSAYALQEAVYAHLTSDISMMGLLSGIYDHVPQDATYPYLYFGEANVSREQLSLMEVETVTIQLFIVSRSQSRGESDDVIGRTFSLLHNNVNLNVVGHHLARLQLSQPETERGKDGASYLTNISLTAVLTKA